MHTKRAAGGVADQHLNLRRRPRVSWALRIRPAITSARRWAPPPPFAACAGLRTAREIEQEIADGPQALWPPASRRWRPHAAQLDHRRRQWIRRKLSERRPSVGMAASCQNPDTDRARAEISSGIGRSAPSSRTSAADGPLPVRLARLVESVHAPGQALTGSEDAWWRRPEASPRTYASGAPSS